MRVKARLRNQVCRKSDVFVHSSMQSIQSVRDFAESLEAIQHSILFVYYIFVTGNFSKRSVIVNIM